MDVEAEGRETLQDSFGVASKRIDSTLLRWFHLVTRNGVYYLRTDSEVVAIDTLTAMLTNELEGPSATAGRETPEHIEVALQHTHLPKLAAAGLITFAQDRQSIELDEINGHGQFIDQAARIDGFAPSAAGD